MNTATNQTSKDVIARIANDYIKTSQEGADDFPANEHDVYKLVEKICRQEMSGLKSANKLANGLKKVIVADGEVFETSVVKMAESYAFDKNASDRLAKDPEIAVVYHNNWDERQFEATIRRDEIRKIIANKGIGLDKVVSEILDTINQGDASESFEKSFNLLKTANLTDYSTILGGKPANVRGILYAIRDMYNHFKGDNADCTQKHAWKSSTPDANIRIAMSYKLLNVIDVKELADILQLEAVALWGAIVPFYDENPQTCYAVRVYDINAMIQGERLADWSSEEVKKGRYVNFYFTCDRAYMHCGLFKGAYLDCSTAAAAAVAELITPNPAGYKSPVKKTDEKIEGKVTFKNVKK